MRLTDTVSEKVTHQVTCFEVMTTCLLMETDIAPNEMAVMPPDEKEDFLLL